MFITKLISYFILFFKYLTIKIQPLQEGYQKIAITKYGQLIRMSSYHVYPMLFLPTWCIIWMFADTDDVFEKILLSLIFAIGAFLMRSIGCVINDLIDLNIDQQVERTKSRAIASGLISRSEAIKAIIFMATLALIILVILPKQVMVVGGIAGILTCIYPFSKRFTYFAQIVLGITFNIGVIIAWLTVSQSCIWQLSIFYIGSVIFTVAYDTIYACQDIEDDMKLGIKSLPMMLVKNHYDIKKCVWNLYKLSAICFGIVGLGMNMNTTFFLLLGGAIYLLYNNLESCDITNSSACAKHFKNSAVFLFILFLGTVFGN